MATLTLKKIQTYEIYILCICIITEKIYTYTKCNSSLAPFQHPHNNTTEIYKHSKPNKNNTNILFNSSFSIALEFREHLHSMHINYSMYAYLLSVFALAIIQFFPKHKTKYKRILGCKQSKIH